VVGMVLGWWWGERSSEWVTEPQGYEVFQRAGRRASVRASWRMGARVDGPAVGWAGGPAGGPACRPSAGRAGMPACCAPGDRGVTHRRPARGSSMTWQAGMPWRDPMQEIRRNSTLHLNCVTVA